MAPKTLVKPELLSWARISAKLDTGEVARRAKLKAEKIESWERGEGGPSLPQLRKLATLYRRPLAVFFLPAPPKEFQTLRDYRSLTAGEPSSFQLNQEIRRAQERREVAIELSGSLGAPAPRFTLRCKQDEDPETVGVRIRNALGITLAQQIAWSDSYSALKGWKEALEAKGVLIFETRRVEVSEARGFSLFESVFPVVGLNGSDSPNGRIFTLGHELAHLLLRTSGICEFFEHTSPQYRELETFCNNVAAALLLPRDAILGEQDIAGLDAFRRLAKKYSVSAEAVVIRLLHLGRISQSTAGRAITALIAQYAKDQASKDDKEVKIPQYRIALKRNGAAFASLVLSAYHADSITLSDASSCLELKVKHFPKLEGVLLARTIQ